MYCAWINTLISISLLMKCIVYLFDTPYQDWTDKFSGLWQTQPHNFALERAFNQLMSAGGTCCCVCSIFDYPSPYLTFDPEKLQQLYQQMSPVKRHRVRKPLSLTVVVQRALIELPKSLLHKCSVADEGGNDRGMPPEESDGEGEEFLTCQSCSICVHRCKY